MIYKRGRTFVTVRERIGKAPLENCLCATVIVAAVFSALCQLSITQHPLIYPSGLVNKRTCAFILGAYVNT